MEKISLSQRELNKRHLLCRLIVLPAIEAALSVNAVQRVAAGGVGQVDAM